MINYLARKISIKQDDFAEFLKHLREKSGSKRLHVLLDNCSVHHSKSVTQLAQALDIDIIFKVLYCPQCNGIELY